MRAARPNRTPCGNSFKPEPSRCSARSWAPGSPKTRRSDAARCSGGKVTRENEALDRVISSSQPDLFISQVGVREAQLCGKAAGSAGSGSGFRLRLGEALQQAHGGTAAAVPPQELLSRVCVRGEVGRVTGRRRSGNSCCRSGGSAAGERGRAAGEPRSKYQV
ncbi:hypothetical protein GBF38_009490 [Nibea albiflora]|uniref:Uncharacterized protein n=1 Tax=Nibea albiflora TaxID=240163 RepID=A0ACB7F951_NIBAL|nr:hypothetical protein GBF38_009490 [Nibea albiflora]